MKNRIRPTESRFVTVERKWYTTQSMAIAAVVENGSNKEYTVKFNSSSDADCLMHDVELGTMLIVKGFMGQYEGKPEFTVYSFEVNNRSKRTFFPSEQVEYINLNPKKKASN